MPMARAGGDWIPLVEYAVRKGVSLSTLRRYIKSQKIQYKLENGKYLVWDDGTAAAASNGSARAPMPVREPGDRVPREEAARMQGKLERLEKELKKAQEEIAELKMLIALYEERIPKKLGN